MHEVDALASAITSEVAASLSLKSAQNDPAFFIIVVAGYIASIAFPPESSVLACWYAAVGARYLLAFTLLT